MKQEKNKLIAFPLRQGESGRAARLQLRARAAVAEMKDERLLELVVKLSANSTLAELFLKIADRIEKKPRKKREIV